MGLFRNREKIEQGEMIKTLEPADSYDIQENEHADKWMLHFILEGIEDDGTEAEVVSEAMSNIDTNSILENKDRDIDELVDNLIDYVNTMYIMEINELDRGMLKKETFIKKVKMYIVTHITGTKTKEQRSKAEEIYKRFESYFWTYDIIDELIEDDEISDIKVYRYDHIRVQRKGHRETSNVKFRSPEHFDKFIERTIIRNHINLSDQNALQNFVDKKSSDKAILRFNISTEYVNSSGGYLLSIRKIPKEKYSTEGLVDVGLIEPELVAYLKERIQSGGGFLVAGKGGSGKTTLVNWMLDYIPEDKSGLVIQENEELFSNHPDLAFQHTVMNRGEGKIKYDLGDLARNGLLLDIDYFVIGEIKGAEALYLLNAVYTGAKGWATVHGASATEAMNKLVDYIKYNSDYSQEEALQMLVHLDTVIFMESFKIKEIAEINGYDKEQGNLNYNIVYKYNMEKGMGEFVDGH